MADCMNFRLLNWMHSRSACCEQMLRTKSGRGKPPRSGSLVPLILAPERVHLLLVDHEFAFLLQTVAQRDDEGLLELRAFALQQRRLDLAFDQFELDVGGSRLFEKVNYDALLPEVDGLADIAGLHVEDLRSRSGQSADVRHLTVGSHQVTGFHGRAYGLGGLLEVMRGPRLVAE